MSQIDKIEENRFDEFQFLIFQVSAAWLGADIEQIAQVRPWDPQVSKHHPVFWLHEKISFGNRNVEYRAPNILMVAHQQAPVGVIIEKPTDIIRIGVEAIEPLPPLIGPPRILTPLWGATVHEGNVIFLVDLYKLLSIESLQENQNENQTQG